MNQHCPVIHYQQVSRFVNEFILFINSRKLSFGKKKNSGYNNVVHYNYGLLSFSLGFPPLKKKFKSSLYEGSCLYRPYIFRGACAACPKGLARTPSPPWHVKLCWVAVPLSWVA
jgi:hypothetical protein